LVGPLRAALLGVSTVSQPNRKLIFLAKPPNAPPDTPVFDAFIDEFHRQLVAFYMTVDTFQCCAVCGHKWASVDDWLAHEPENYRGANDRTGVACKACVEGRVP
jgi:hypothetical protein